MTPNQRNDAWVAAEPIVQRAVHGFHRRHGGDLEELLANAALIWWRTHLKYDPARCPTGGYAGVMAHSVYFGLVDMFRAATSRGKRPPDVTAGDVARLWVDMRPPVGAGREFLDALGQDAREVARLALEQPGHVGAAAERGVRACRAAIRRRLLLRGWSPCRVRAAIGEVEAALAGA